MTTLRDLRRHREVPGRSAARVAGLVLAVALGATACTSPSPAREATASATATARPVGAAATATRAAELESGLTAVLVERVHVSAEARDRRSRESAAALDASSVALSDVLGKPYREIRGPLLDALRDCDEAQVRGDELDGCRERLEEVVRDAVPRLASEQLEGRLAVTAAATPEALRVQSRQARGTARVLAGAVAADRSLGPTATPASSLRADLTWLLVEHVSLAVASAQAPDEAASAALAANADELAALVGESYPAAATPFRQAWNAHLDRLAGWTGSLRAGDTERARTLRASVIGLASAIGPLLATHVEGLPTPRLDQETRPALGALAVAVEAAALGRTGGAALEQRAVAAMLAPAALVAAAVAEDRRLA